MHLYTIRKRGVLQLALQLNCWVASNTCNSLYLYVVSVNKQVTWVLELQLTIYTVQLIVIQLQLYQNNSFSTTMQLHYNCTHDVMLTSLIVIHLWKFNTLQYEKFMDIKKKSKYWFQLSYDCWWWSKIVTCDVIFFCQMAY